MEQILLNHAKSQGLNVYQNILGQWVIKGIVDRKMWILQQQRENSWLMTFDGERGRGCLAISNHHVDQLSQLSLSTEKSISALNLFLKHTNL